MNTGLGKPQGQHRKLDNDKRANQINQSKNISAVDIDTDE